MRLKRKWTFFRKGKSMTSVSLLPTTPYNKEAGKQEKEGAVLFSITPANGPESFDWSKTEHFSLNITEIGTLLAYFKGKLFNGSTKLLQQDGSLRFFHDNGPQKALRFAENDNGAVMYWVNMDVKKPDGSKAKLSTSIDIATLEVLVALLQAAILEITEWKAF